ncbi:MAG: hypothetical protein LBD58_05650 [Treponema sp.]|nr:hypothetical protein [Treponema sp.]
MPAKNYAPLSALNQLRPPMNAGAPIPPGDSARLPAFALKRLDPPPCMRRTAHAAKGGEGDRSARRVLQFRAGRAGRPVSDRVQGYGEGRGAEEEKPSGEERDDAGDDAPASAEPGEIPVYIGGFVVLPAESMGLINKRRKTVI